MADLIENFLWRFNYLKNKKIIYVGKAINLKKRVKSYFQKNIKSRKTINLVKNIDSIEHVTVQSESDALLLENSLIKKINLNTTYC